jgi:glycosyltransferase involved in cell wall biosynthesis
MKKQKLPLVSVIMPVYNAGKFLVPAIESILKQTYRHFELIIVDDASTDGSKQIITRYKKRHPKVIHAIFLKKHLDKGGDACANIAFRRARGSFIARMDADDISHPDRLEKQILYMQAHPDVLLLGAQARVIDSKGTIIGDKTVPTDYEHIYKSFLIFHPVIHPTVIVRRRLLPKRNYLYKIKYSANNDLYTFFELLNIGKFENMDEELLDYRVHMGNDSLTNPKERYFNTLNIRLRAITGGYVPTFSGILATLVQTILIALLPSRFIVPLYLYAKGIMKLPAFSMPKYFYEIRFQNT